MHHRVGRSLQGSLHARHLNSEVSNHSETENHSKRFLPVGTEKKKKERKKNDDETLTPFVDRDQPIDLHPYNSPKRVSTWNQG